MNKVTVKGTEYKLAGEQIKVGATIVDFKAKDKDNKDFNFKSVKGMKVISVFPALNTRVCDAQTLQIVNWAKDYKNVKFVSITHDTVETINSWCAAHGIDNIMILSDREYGEFGKLTNLYIKEWDKLARGFIILDDRNKIIDQSFNTEESIDPNYALVRKYL